MRVKLIRVGLIVVALGLLSAAFLIGQATGQQKKYPTLPDEFSSPYFPTVLEWRMLEYNATSAWQRAGYDRLTRYKAPVSFSALSGTFVLFVGTEPQPSTSKRAFLALPDREQKAEWRNIADGILKTLRIYIDPGAAVSGEEGAINSQSVEMEFYILGGGPFAKLKNAELLLPGEKGFD